MSETHPQLEAIAERVSELYSLPSVAMEVVRLADQPNIDTETLARCIERDPALTVKVLRVVNSSAYGLPHRVSNLKQAVGMLGTNPLKLLVLGFSLPEKLFVHTRQDLLAWYWATSLTRAVAARELSQSLWQQPGDDTFLAALLQDIGLLALLRVLNDPYAKFLGRVIAERRDLAAAELEELGFDHRQLTVVMLTRWNLPDTFVEAIGMKERPLRLVRRNDPPAEIAKVLQLADLLAQLVGQRRIGVLPDLLEAGQLYCDLTKPKLFDLVGDLQPKVDQLASVLSLTLPDGRDYEQVLADAHHQLARLAESVTGPLMVMDSLDEPCDELLTDSQDLESTVQSFLEQAPASATGTNAATMPGSSRTTAHAPHQRTTAERDTAATKTAPITAADVLLACVMSAARGCRMRRSELSLLLVELDAFDSLPVSTRESWGKLLVQAASAEIPADAELIRVSASQRAVVLPDFDRRQAVELAGHIISRLEKLYDREADELPPPTVNAGVATATSIFKNFSAMMLVDGAQRSLSAARSSGGSSVKSIEVL